MASLREHLQSPQFPGEDPATAGDEARPGRSIARFTGGWAAAGQPRWKAYAMFLSGIVVGVFLMLTTTGGFDLVAWIGVALIAFGIFGSAETMWGKRFPRP